MGFQVVQTWERGGCVPPQQGQGAAVSPSWPPAYVHVSSSPNMKSRFQNEDRLTQALIKHNLAICFTFVVTCVQSSVQESKKHNQEYLSAGFQIRDLQEYTQNQNAVNISSKKNQI